jgi:hypothetical protein
VNPRDDLLRHEGELQEAGCELGCAKGAGDRRLGSAFGTAQAERTKNAYGCNRACAIVLGMRYVIVIAAVAFLLIWDGLYNQGRYLDTTVRDVTHVVRYVTGKI